MILLCLDRSWSECFIKGVTHLLMYAFICKCLTNRSFRKPLLLVFTRLITWSKSSSQQCGDAASQQLPNGCWKWQGRRQPLPCPHSQRLMGSFISPWPVFCLFAPLLLWKWIAPVKWRNHALKKTHPYNTTEAYLFHLKGEVWGHPPVLPQWHFPTWHSVTFPVKYCWYSCSGIKSMSKRDTSIKALSLPLYLPPPLSLPPSISVSSPWTLCFPPLHAATQAYMHYLLSAVDLHLQVLEEVFLIQKDYQKFYHPEYAGDRHKVCDWKKLMMLFWAKIQRLTCSNIPGSAHARDQMTLTSAMAIKM